MAAVQLRYLWTPTIKGRLFAYYRRAGQRTRLPDIAAPGFLAAYSAAHAAAEAQVRPVRPGRPLDAPGSLAALIIAYRGSPEWRELSTRT